MRHVTAVFVATVVLFGSGLLTDLGGGNAAKAQDVRAVDFTMHGVAAEVANPRGIAVAQTEAGERKILAWVSTTGDASLLVINVESGETKQFWPETGGGGSPFSILLTEAGHYYTYTDSHLMVYDVNAGEWLAIEPGPGRLGMSFAEADDGTVYTGLYPDAHLVSFDPQTRELTNHGPMAEEEWDQYPRDMVVDDQGWVYAGITRASLVAFNPDTGEARQLIDREDREDAGGGRRLFRGVDGAVYGRAASGLPWMRMYEGEAETLSDEPTIESVPAITGTQGALFREFPDGSRLEDIHIPERRALVRLGAEDAAPEAENGSEIREIEIEYESDGVRIHSLIEGPDGRIYGSTGHPLYFFAFDPAEDAFESIELDGGHFNALAVQRGHVFAAIYSGGTLHQYDPEAPWDSEGENPKVVASANDQQAMITRPYVLIAHPDGRHLIMGGFYDWRGVAGGGLLIYDMESEEAIKLSKHDLLVGHSTRALAALPEGDLVGGTTVSTRGRVEPKAEQAKLYVLDWPSHELVHEQVVFEDGGSIRELQLGPDGERIYGIGAGNRFFVFDPAQRAIVHRETFEAYSSAAGGQAPRMMKLGPDEKFYALFQNEIVQIDPRTYEHRAIGSPPTSIGVGIAMHEGRIYFTHLGELWSARLEGLE